MSKQLSAIEKKIAERAMAQDYWVQVVTNMNERALLISQAPKAAITKYTVAAMVANEKRNYNLLMDYIFETRRDAVMAHAKALNEELNSILNS